METVKGLSYYTLTYIKGSLLDWILIMDLVEIIWQYADNCFVLTPLVYTAFDWQHIRRMANLQHDCRYSLKELQSYGPLPDPSIFGKLACRRVSKNGDVTALMSIRRMARSLQTYEADASISIFRFYFLGEEEDLKNTTIISSIKIRLGSYECYILFRSIESIKDLFIHHLRWVHVGFGKDHQWPVFSKKNQNLMR